MHNDIIFLLSPPYQVNRKGNILKEWNSELRNVRALWKYEGSAAYCRCSAISLSPDISHINHFSPIDTEQDKALLPHPHPTASQHPEWACGRYTFSPCLQVGLNKTSGKSIQKGATHDPLVSARCHLNTSRVTVTFVICQEGWQNFHSHTQLPVRCCLGPQRNTPTQKNQ